MLAVDLYSLWKLRKPIQLVGTWKVTAKFNVEGPSGDYFYCVTVRYIRTKARDEYFADVTKHYTTSAFLLLYHPIRTDLCLLNSSPV